MTSSDLTQGSITRHLLGLSAPLMLGNLLQQFYNTMDAWVIGRYGGEMEFAAIGVAGTVMNLFLFAIVGACTGVSVIFARFYGAGDKRGFRREHGIALITGLTAVFFMTGTGICLLSSILSLIHTPEEIRESVGEYLKVILLSLPAGFLYNFYSALLRATGDTKAALKALAAAVGTNLVLDLLFVAGFSWGISGAAFATALAQGMSAVFCILYFRRKLPELVCTMEDCRMDKLLFLETIHFGMATGLQQSGLYMGKMLVQGAVNTGGTVMISAYTAATRIEGFINSIGDSGCAATSVLTAQNLGAGNRDRVQNTFWKSLLLLGLLGIGSSALLYGLAEPAAKAVLGNGGNAALTGACGYLHVIAVFYVLCFTGNTFAGYFAGRGNVWIPFIGSLGHIAFRALLSGIWISRFGLNTVAMATGGGWLLVNLFWAGMYWWKVGQGKKERTIGSQVTV